MGRQINRLNVRFVQTVREPGLYADGGGLYLSTTNGGKRWVFVFRWDGKRKEMGLGSARDIPLARARELAAQARAMLAEGRNPIGVRNAEREAAAEPEPDPIPTFGAFAESYVDSVEEGWRNPKHRQQWRNSLKQHAAALADKSVADITTQDVLGVLQPIWLTTPETASRVRGRIEKGAQRCQGAGSSTAGLH